MSAEGLSLADASAIFKEYYGPDNDMVRDVTFRDRPVLALMKKRMDARAQGKVIPIPIQTTTSQGVSADFATAQSNQRPPLFSQFDLTTVKKYSLATIDNEAMEAGRSSKGAFIDMVDAFMKPAYNGFAYSLGRSVYRGRTGNIGSISTIGVVGAGVIALVNPTDAVNFQYGQVLTVAATPGTYPVTVRAALGYVINVDFESGYVTVSDTQV